MIQSRYFDGQVVARLHSLLRKQEYPASARLSKRIGEALEVVRAHRSLTQQQLAERMTQALINRQKGRRKATSHRRVTQAYISKVESGTVQIKWDRLELFCSCLDCTPERVVELARFLAEQDGKDETEILTEILAVTGGNQAEALRQTMTR